MYLFSLDHQDFIITKVHSNHCHKDRYKSAIELREINPYIYGQLTFGNGVKKMQWRKKRFLNNDAGKTVSPCKKVNSDLTLYTQIHLKFIRDLTIKSKIQTFRRR